MKKLDKKFLEQFTVIYNEDSPFASPFTCGNKSYVTDTRILLAVPALGDVSVKDGEPFLKATELLTLNPPPEPRDVEAWVSLSSTLIQAALCLECKGCGEVTFSNDYHSYENWCGDLECKSCNGIGLREGFRVSTKHGSNCLRIGNHLIAACYIQDLLKLPDCCIAPYYSDWKNPIPIRFTGGIGLLMGVNPLTPVEDDES